MLNTFKHLRIVQFIIVFIFGLFKISVLENASETAKDFANEIAEATGAEVVAVIGRKIVLYKMAEKPEHRKISAQL